MAKASAKAKKVVNKRIRKKRAPGRPKRPGGPDLVVPVRLSRSTIRQIDLARAGRGSKLSRSAVLRRLIDSALAAIKKIEPPADFE
jgi:hypothetical protein